MVQIIKKVKTRDPIKWIRDRAKARYPTKVICAICSSTENLQLHHYNTLSLLFAKWPRNKEPILVVRDDFIAEHEKELFVDVVCLCKNCHYNRLHKIYGKTPALSTNIKQKNWVQKMREKNT